MSTSTEQIVRRKVAFKLQKPLEQITDSELSTLRELDLSDHGIPFGDTLGGLRFATGLQTLNLSENGIDDDNLNKLDGLLNLQSLDLSSNKIRFLRDLRVLTSLKELNLAGNPFADKELQHLKPLKALQRLDVSGCENVTEQGLGELKKALPRLNVIG